MDHVELAAKLDLIMQHLEAGETRFQSIEQRFSRAEAKLDAVHGLVEGVSALKWLARAVKWLAGLAGAFVAIKLFMVSGLDGVNK